MVEGKAPSGWMMFDVLEMNEDWKIADSFCGALTAVDTMKMLECRVGMILQRYYPQRQ
jgi:hypothetical protein